MNRLLHNNIVRAALAVTALVAVNAAGSCLFFRIDLTQEKRYTLAPITRQLMNGLDQPLQATLYLSGELNPGFARLAKSTVETIDELGVYAGRGIRTTVVDVPNLTKAEGDSLTALLDEWGMAGVPVFETTEDGRKTRSTVYPYVLIEYADRQVMVNLLQNLPGLSGDENLNRSVENLEYCLTDGIRRVSDGSHPRIAFIEGHGEAEEIDVVEAADALARHFTVERGAIGTDAAILDPYSVIIIAKPSRRFSESDKYIIDQYVMRGGKVLWLVDAVTMTLDSLRSSASTIGLLADFNIDDMLFRYGFRINPEVIEDAQCAMVPISVAQPGQQPRIVPMPWRFSPLLQGNGLSPITRNVNAVRADFASYIDTVGIDLDLRRTVLLRSSAYTKADATPVYATLADIHRSPVREEFNRSHLPVAVMAEGTFQSVFANRRKPREVTGAAKQLDRSRPTQMIVVADGDIIRNDVRFRNAAEPRIVPLGYDEMSKQTFGNKDFIVNAVQYMADDAGWMSLRNRNFSLRLLDRRAIAEGTARWKAAATALPLAVLTALGLAFVFIRRRRYGKHASRIE